MLKGLFSTLVPKAHAAPSDIIGELDTSLIAQPEWAQEAISDPENAIVAVVSKILTWVIVAAAFVCLGMLIWGAFNYMTSGGNKTKIEDARNRIIFAVVGLVLVSLSFAIAVIVQNLVFGEGVGPLAF